LYTSLWQHPVGGIFILLGLMWWW